MSETYKFPCGCSYNVLESRPGEFPKLDFSLDHIPEDCPATWSLLAKGLTKGVFQLESRLGRQWTKKLKPESGEHMGALGALLRPGCVGGDTNVAVNMIPRQGRVINCKKVKIRDLYTKFVRQHAYYQNGIVSMDESECLLFQNRCELVTFSGDKEVYRVHVKTGINSFRKNYAFYNLECTLDHKLLTHNRDWIELKDLVKGERIAVINNRKNKRRTDAVHKFGPGKKYFRENCWQHYEYKCVMCGWQDGSLDVNHIRDNRRSNNHYKNLCFLCPNHHRVFTERNLAVHELAYRREALKLRNSKHVIWVEFQGADYVGVKDTYDISVAGPNHNFIAGNFIVHNCLMAVDENNVSMTEHYCRRKNGLEEIEGFHPVYDKVTGPTYNVLTYQESLMGLGKDIAGFDLIQVDRLRKACGKKSTEELAKVKEMFLAGAKEQGLVTDDEAQTIWGWMEKSGRYLFNKSHAIAYGLIGYDTAYIKAHFPLAFFTSWLMHAKEVQNPREEIAELVEDAKLFDIEVRPPSVLTKRRNFHVDDNLVRFGLSDIKGIGDKQLNKLLVAIETIEREKAFDQLSWLEFLVQLTPQSSTNVISRLIQSGALSHFKLSRRKMLTEYETWCDLTDKEQLWAVNNLSGSTLLVELLQRLAHTKKEGGGCANHKRVSHVTSLIHLLENPPTTMTDTPLWITYVEEDLLGIPLSCSKIDSCDVSDVNTSCKEYLAGRNGFMVFGCEVRQVREVEIKRGNNKGKKMAFMSVADNSCAMDDVAVPPEVWEESSSLFVEGELILFQGERYVRKDKSETLNVKHVWPATLST